MSSRRRSSNRKTGTDSACWLSALPQTGLGCLCDPALARRGAEIFCDTHHQASGGENVVDACEHGCVYCAAKMRAEFAGRPAFDAYELFERFEPVAAPEPA